MPIAGISLYVEPTSYTTLEESKRAFQNMVDNNPNILRIVNSTNRNITQYNLAAYQVTFYDYAYDRSYKIMQLWTIRDGFQYSIVYTSDPGLFDYYYPIAQKMIDSFKISK